MENQYPLDFDALEKGQLLDIALIECVFGTKYVQGSTKWAFLLMSLQAQIHDKTEISCRIDHDAIALMTDAEASEHNFRQMGRHARGIVRKTEKLLQVDRAELTSSVSEDHDRRIRIASAYAGAVTSVRREVQGLPVFDLPKRSE